MCDLFRLSIPIVIPLVAVATLGFLGARAAQALTFPSGQITAVQHPLSPLAEEFDPDNTGAPDDSTGAGGR